VQVIVSFHGSPETQKTTTATGNMQPSIEKQNGTATNQEAKATSSRVAAT